MCGIVGYIPGAEQTDHEAVIKAMTDTIAHRGPDSEGAYITEQVVLGFRRLKIIDLSDRANQPIENEDGRYCMVFNGEIYNYQALREELVAAGHVFRSETDSEVVLHGYEAWGERVLKRLRGMFAFAIWDTQTGQLFMARDMFGIKPLYYTSHTTDGSFLFGSEIKSFLPHPAFRKELNKHALVPYLNFQYNPLDETFFAGVYKMAPGTWMRIDAAGNMRSERFWDFDFVPQNDTLDHHVAAITEVMKESVACHQISDVKVGAFLSGGIDSSFVTALFRPQATFSVGFTGRDERFDETVLAEDLAERLGLQHHSRLIGAEDFFGILPTLQYHMDEPQSNLSSVPLYFLAQLASEHVTVVLSGEGADELFGGYDSYVRSPRLAQYDRLPQGLRQGLARAVRGLPQNRVSDFLLRGGEKVSESFIGEASIFHGEDARTIVNPDYRVGPTALEFLQPAYRRLEGKDPVAKKQSIDIRFWMPGDILLKADKMSSAHSLELRVPYLDREVMSVAEKLPQDYRVNGQISKYALRKAALDILPEDWAKRPKKGFPVPIRYWLLEDAYYEYVRGWFSKAYVAEFFDQAALLQMLEDHYHEKGHYQRQMYTVLSFLIWYDEFFIKR